MAGSAHNHHDIDPHQRLPIKIGESTIHLSTHSPLEDLLAQVHQHVDKLVYVVNGSEIGWYDQLDHAPIGGYKQELVTYHPVGDAATYHLRHKGTDDTYVCYNAMLVERLVRSIPKN